ncbi:MAG TPA: VTT domain-containing protein [Acidimicrobiales bacterium]
MLTASIVTWILHPDMHGIADRGAVVFLAIVAGIVFTESGLLVGLFLPGDSLLFSAGLVVGITGRPNIGFLLLVAFVAAVAGDQFGYAIGRRTGASLLRRPDTRFVKQAHLRAGQEFFQEHGPRAVLLARFVPVVRTVTPVLAGIGRMPYRTFTAWNVAGAALWAALATLLGYGLGRRFPGIETYLTPVLLVVVAVSVAPMAISLLRRRRAGSSPPASIATGDELPIGDQPAPGQAGSGTSVPR